MSFTTTFKEALKASTSVRVNGYENRGYVSWKGGRYVVPGTRACTVHATTLVHIDDRGYAQVEADGCDGDYVEFQFLVTRAWRRWTWPRWKPTPTSCGT